MKTNLKLARRGFTLVELLVVMAIIATLAGIATPVIMKNKKKGDLTQTISNAKQIYFALFEFDQEFLSFPNETTATRGLPSVGLPEGAANDANDCYNQLIVAGTTNKSEAIFFAKGSSAIKPDDNISGTSSLEAGENGFGYVMGLGSGSSTGSVVAMAPLVVGSTESFNPDPYGGFAVLLRLDGSTSSERISESGKVIKNGNNVFSAENPSWGSDGSGSDDYGLGDVSGEFDTLSSNFHNLTVLGVK